MDHYYSFSVKFEKKCTSTLELDQKIRFSVSKTIPETCLFDMT